ncbi:SSI family serine proteinase inhibitor [Streptomyces shenzhenensis]|uniref:SSI family serine proteinase inhibitor n=1 Tax=Streptomyces shenzhenensis TaxID=943815 RepID=UPI0015F0D0E4|nr:SSI family serine proteinase inhibitor [Streptomyces shenzhenensis]
MTHLSKTTAAAGVLLAAAALLTAGPAQAAPDLTRDGDYLYLTVTTGDGHSGDTRVALLLCDPPQGHSRAAEACARLDAVGGDITRIPPARGAMCPMLYAPVTAQARGQWNGRPIEYRETFANPCQLAARTGPVFAFED